MLAEQQTEWIINNILVNNGWVIDNKLEKNVYFQKAKPEHEHKLENFCKKKGYKKPDYILYKGNKPIGIIEAKRGGEPLNEALKQANEYAEMLEAPLIFASNGAYVETNHLIKQKPLFINGEKVDKIIKYKEAIEFIKKGDNEIYTIPPELIKSKEDLIKIFKNVNNLLRKANIFSGYDRISEFSSILFLKLISEKEGKKSYWNSIKQQDDDFIFSHLNQTVISDLEKHYGGGVFSEINIKKPSLLRQIMDMLDPLILSDIKTDIKGDAFEYFLKNMNQADNDLGQYFTPRHIIKVMVHLVDPKFKETIYDPFCGTGGFLIEAFNHIKENSIIKTDEDKKILKENTLFGRDATKVSTIAKKNMILHGDGHSNIQEIDSLENPVQNKMSVILTNIPFSLKDVDYTNFYYNGLGKKNGDAVCVLHCLNALEEGGRMAVVVPEGFLFKKELKEVRKFLLSKANLELVVSLPQGVFQPYTGVKTDILYFTNAHKPQPQEGYYYFEVKNDGFTLDSHRRKIENANDIHKLEASNIRKTERELLKVQGFEFILFKHVERNDYNLIASTYKKDNNETSSIKLFTQLLDDGLIQGKKGKTITRAKAVRGNIPVIAGGQTSPYFHDQSNFEGNVITISASGAYSGFVWYHNDPIWASDCSIVYSTNENKLVTKYLYYVLKSQQEKIYQKQHGSGQPHIYLRDLSNIRISLPSLEEQQKIVHELDSYQKIVESAKEIVESWKPYFEIDKNCELENLGNLCEIRPKKPKLNDKLQVSFINMAMMPVDGYKFFHSEIRQMSEVEKSYTYFAENDILLAKITPCFENGKCGIAKNLKNGIGFGSTEFIVLRCNKNLLPEYLYTIISSDTFRDIGKKSMSGTAGQQRVSLDFVKNYQIPFPPIHVQQRIVDKLETERKMVESQKVIIKLFQSKINDKLDSIWQSDKENNSFINSKDKL